eukprot:1626444-Rhodomonas_salina.1
MMYTSFMKKKAAETVTPSQAAPSLSSAPGGVIRVSLRGEGRLGVAPTRTLPLPVRLPVQSGDAAPA